MEIVSVKKVKGGYDSTKIMDDGRFYAFDEDPANYWIKVNGMDTALYRVHLDPVLAIQKQLTRLESFFDEPEEAGPALATEAALNEIRKMVENTATKDQVFKAIQEFHAKIDETQKLADVLVQLKEGGFSVDDIVRLQQAGMLPDPNRIRYEMDNRFHDMMNFNRDRY